MLGGLWLSLGLGACGGGGGGEPGGVIVTPPNPPPPAEPVDFRDEIVYQLLTDRFFNGDPGNDNGQLARNADPVDPGSPVGWHGGDLAGVRQKLEEGYFQRMGFTAIWISPVVLQVPPPGNGGGVNSNRPFTGFHGYWADRFDAIEPHFGTLAELRALGEAADVAGVKLIVDVVVNHVGPGSVLLGQQPGWFRTGEQCGVDDVTLCLAGLPDFRQELPEVRDFLLGTIRYLTEGAAIDGLRVDTMKHVGDEFWASFFSDASPASPKRLWTVGEVFTHDVTRIAHYLDVVRSPSVFDFPLRSALVDSLARGASLRRLADIFAQDASYEDPTRLATFLDNHDVWRFVSEAEAAGMDQAEANQRLDMALTLLYLARGIPVVYYGTEAAMRGQGDSFDQPLGSSSREDMDFAALADSPLDERLAALASARGAYPALRRGEQQTLYAPGAACGPAQSSLDPALDFGDVLFVRGSFDGWSDPPRPDQQFVNLGGGQYQAAAWITEGQHEFKVAAADWDPEFASTDVDTQLDVSVTLAASPGAGNNSRIRITASGCHHFALNAVSPVSPVLTVTRSSVTEDPDLLVLARTGEGQQPVLVVVNNQREPVDLTALEGGVEVRGLLPDGALEEVSGASHDLSIIGGRLQGRVPGLTTLGLVAR